MSDTENQSNVCEHGRVRRQCADCEVINLYKELEEKEQTITSIRKQFEETDWGARNIELTEQLFYWRELAGTRDNKLTEQAKEIERLRKEINDRDEVLVKGREIYERYSLSGGNETP